MGRPRTAAPKPVALIPRTTAVTGVGLCGHTYSQRHTVFPLTGLPKTPENLAELTQFKNDAARHLGRYKCDECLAQESLTGSTGATSDLIRLFHLSALPALEGTVRVRSFAAGVRSDFMLAALHIAYTEAINMVYRPTVLDVLLLDAVRSRWTVDQESASDDVTSLAAELDATPNVGIAKPWRAGEASDPRMGLALWLLARKHIGDQDLLWKETRSRMWISMHRLPALRGRLEPRPLTATEVSAAKLIAMVPGWADRDHAWTAFDALIQDADSGSAALISGRHDMSVQALSEELAVMKALSPQQRHDDVPF